MRISDWSSDVCSSDLSNLLRSPTFYTEHEIDLRLGGRVTAIDIANAHVDLEDGTRHTYDALLLATGAVPVRLAVPVADLPHVHYLRTFADSRVLVTKALLSRRAAVRSDPHTSAPQSLIRTSHAVFRSQ